MADFVFPVPIVTSGVFVPITNIPNGPSYYVPTDQYKLSQRPPGWEEIPEGYGEGSDERGSWTTRTYLGPWSQRMLFRLWLRGTAWRDANGLIKRVTPAQDPVSPWQYCLEEKLVGGKGAWVNDPNVFPITNTGQTTSYELSAAGGSVLSTAPSPQSPPVLVTEGAVIENEPPPQPMPIPQVMAFVDNDQGGNTAQFTNNPLSNIQMPSGLFDDGFAVVRATFRSVDYQILNDTDAANSQYALTEMSRFVKRHWKPSVEALPLANIASVGGLNFVDGPFAPTGPEGHRTFSARSRIPEPGVKLMPVAQVEWAWYEVPDPPLEKIDGLIGTVNKDSFDVNNGPFNGYGSYKPETLLFGQPDYQEHPRDLAGQKLWTIKIRAMYRPQGWNAFPASNGLFYQARLTNTFAQFQLNNPGQPLPPDIGKVYRPHDWNVIFGTSNPVRWN